MEWYYIWGDREEKLVEMSIERNQDVPAIASKPILTPEASDVARAFKLLTKLRGSNGFGGLNPIPLSEVKVFIEMFGSPWIGREDFVWMIVLVDEHFRNLVSSKAAEPKKVDFGKMDEGDDPVSARRIQRQNG